MDVFSLVLQLWDVIGTCLLLMMLLSSGSEGDHHEECRSESVPRSKGKHAIWAENGKKKHLPVVDR